MRTASEKVNDVHERARTIRKNKDILVAKVLGAATTLVLIGVIVFISMFEGTLHPIDDTGQQGSALLFEGAGGYVLVAVVSFTAAVIITVLCIRWNRRKKDRGDVRSDVTE